MNSDARLQTAVSSSSLPAPPRRLANLALVAMLGIYFFAFFQRSAVPGTIFNELQREWNLSASAIVGMGSIYLCVYGSMQLVVGIAADRFGGTRTLLVGGVILALGATLFPLSATAEEMYATRAVAAIGDSFVYLCIIKEVSLLFDHRRFVLLVGTVQFVGTVGGMMAMLPFERATHLFGWRPVLLATGAATGVIVGLNYLILPKLNHFVPPTTKFTLRPVIEILRNRRNWPIFVSALINFPVYFGIQVGIGKKFIQDVVGLSSQQAATFTLIMMTVSAVVCLGSGFLLRHTGGRRKPFLFFGAGLLCGAVVLLLAGVFFKTGGWLFLTGYILLAASNIVNPISMTVMKELNDPRDMAQALALINTLAYCGVALMMTLSGTVLDLFKGAASTSAGGVIYPPRAYETVLVIFFGLVIISLIATGFVHETHHTPPAAGDLPDIPETF